MFALLIKTGFAGILPKNKTCCASPVFSCCRMAYCLNALVSNMIPMDAASFFIEFSYKNKLLLTEVKPCCQQNNIYYYDIAMKNQYQFTVTPTFEDKGIKWKVSLKNADKQVDAALIDIIGREIERRLM